MTRQTANTENLTTTQVYRVHIKASAQAIWDAVIRPEWTARYGYSGLVDYDLGDLQDMVSSTWDGLTKR